MKYHYIFLMLFSLFFVSCDEEESIIETNSEFVMPQNIRYEHQLIATLEDFKKNPKTISRRELLRYNPKLQKLIHSYLTPQNVYAIVQDKLEGMISPDNEAWSAEEKVYFTKLLDEFSVDVLNSEEYKLVFLDFTEQWLAEGIEQFGWDGLKVDLIANTMQTNSVLEKQFIKRQRVNLVKSISLQELKSSSSTSGGAECSTSSDWCSSGSCVSDFSYSRWGCGTFWMYACDGTCR